MGRFALHVLSVGQSYHPERRSWPTAEQVRLDRGTAELIRFWPEPSRDEVRQHETGASRFALIDESPDLLLLAYQFGDLSWSDSPFQVHRMTTDRVGWPAGPGTAIVFRTILVDSVSGIVRALRYDEWSEEFSNAVRVAIAEQLIHEFDDRAAGDRMDRLYAEYSSPEVMVRYRTTASCRTTGPTTGGNVPVPVSVYSY